MYELGWTVDEPIRLEVNWIINTICWIEPGVNWIEPDLGNCNNMIFWLLLTWTVVTSDDVVHQINPSSRQSFSLYMLAAMVGSVTVTMEQTIIQQRNDRGEGWTWARWWIWSAGLTKGVVAMVGVVVINIWRGKCTALLIPYIKLIVLSFNYSNRIFRRKKKSGRT